MLDYRIDTFLTLCETRSYTKTAERLHVSQPSVTQHIKALEQYYGCALFHYTGRTLELTEAGEYLFQKEQSMMFHEKEITMHMEQLRKGERLRIGMTPSVSESFVPQYLALFIREWKLVQFSFQVQEVQQLREQLTDGTLDVVFAEEFFLNSAIFERYPYHRERLVLVSDPETAARLYGKSMHTILRELLLLPPEGSGLRELVIQALHNRNFALTDFQRVMVVDSIPVMRELLAQHVGISILFESNVQTALQNRRLQRLHIEDFSLFGTFQFIFRKESFRKERYLALFQQFQELAAERLHMPDEM